MVWLLQKIPIRMDCDNDYLGSLRIFGERVLENFNPETHPVLAIR